MDDREGFIKHPRKGKIPTYMFQRKHNIHCFYDHDSGQWMRMPIGYELHHEMVAKLVDQVEEALPNWNDRHDILSLLRQCNYDADECIKTYLYLDGDEWLNAPKTTKESKTMNSNDEKLNELEQAVKQLKMQMDEETKERAEAETVVKKQEEIITTLEVENNQSEAQLAVLQQERPKTNMRPKTPQTFSYCGPDFKDKQKLTDVRDTHHGYHTPVNTDLTGPSGNARLPISTCQDDNNPLILSTSPHIPVSPTSVSSTSPSDLNVNVSSLVSDSDFIEHENINPDEHVKIPPIGPYHGERFLAPPSQFYTTHQATSFFSLRQRALTTDIGYTGTVMPYGTAGVRKEERVLFPDGTVYHLTATWIPDPKIELISTSETQTEQDHTNFRNVVITSVSSTTQTDPQEDIFLSSSSLSLTSTNTF